jgi:hypothetical protein
MSSNIYIKGMVSESHWHSRLLVKFQHLFPQQNEDISAFEKKWNNFLDAGEDVNQDVGLGMSVFQYGILCGAPIGFAEYLVNNHGAKITFSVLKERIHQDRKEVLVFLLSKSNSETIEKFADYCKMIVSDKSLWNKKVCFIKEIQQVIAEKLHCDD